MLINVRSQKRVSGNHLYLDGSLVDTKFMAMALLAFVGFF